MLLPPTVGGERHYVVQLYNCLLTPVSCDKISLYLVEGFQ